MSGFADKLNVQNSVNSTGICTSNVRNVWICREIEKPELSKFNKKFCTLYLHGMSGFAKKLNIPNSENSTGNCVHYLRTARLDLQKN